MTAAHPDDQTVRRHIRAEPRFQSDAPTSDDMALINRLAPAPLHPEQVYIRSMYLCSTHPCESDGCQFSREALEQIAQQIIGLSVLPGHNRHSLPLARFFKAQVVEHEGEHEEASNEPVHLVRAWFYWLRETSGARDLLLNIDGGIYREVSLAWKYRRWHCSICNAENGTCLHRVGEIYNNRRCSRVINEVNEVLEGSLVYKAADRHTVLTGMRHCHAVDEPEWLLIASPQDPLLQCFERQSCLQERLEFSDLSQTFHESIERLWVRAAAWEPIERCAQDLLAEGGVCLAEIVVPGELAAPKGGILIRENDGLTALPHNSAQEDDDAAVWPI